MYPPKRRRLPLAGLGLISAGGVLGVALSMPGAAYADPGQELSTSSDASSDVSSDASSGAAKSRSSSSDRTLSDRAPSADQASSDRAPSADVVMQRRAAGPTTAGVAMVGARLERAVAEGRLTREMADTILAAAEAGLLNGDLIGGPGRHPGPYSDRQGR